MQDGLLALPAGDAQLAPIYAQYLPDVVAALAALAAAHGDAAVRMKATLVAHIARSHLLSAGHTPKVTIPSPTMLHFRGGRGGISKTAYPELDPVFYDDVAKAYGDDLTVTTRDGKKWTLAEIAQTQANRMISIFARGEDGRRPVYGNIAKFQDDPLWRDYISFHEYFHGDTGVGLGASHQTGWTGLAASLIDEWR